MQISRRRLGRIVLGMSAAGTAFWCGIGFARSASGTIDVIGYPVLARLASLYRDERACRRIASALSTSVAAELIGSGLTRVEENAARAWMDRRSAARGVLDSLLADDFRRGRTVRAGGFLLAETEAVLVLVRSSVG